MTTWVAGGEGPSPSPWPDMRRQVCLTFLFSFLTFSFSSIRLKRQLNFGPQATENKQQRPKNKVFFGFPNPFGSGFAGIGGSNGNTCSCATTDGRDPGEGVSAPRLGQVCNCATSVEFGGDCKGRGQGDRWDFEETYLTDLLCRYFGCGCGGPGNGVFTFSQRKRRQTEFGGKQQETQERIFNLRCITAFVTGRKKITNT